MSTKKKAVVKKPAAKKKTKVLQDPAWNDKINTNYDGRKEYMEEESTGATIHSKDGKTVPCAVNEKE